MNAPALPGSLAANPRLDRWICFNRDRTVTLFTGKVEIGQGIVTALAQIAADELDVPFDRLEVVSGDTARSPNEGYTSGSQSMEQGGKAVRLACAEIRRLFLDAAAKKLEVHVEDIVVADGEFRVSGTDMRIDYWALTGEVDLARDATASVAPKPAAARKYAGRSLPRLDIAAKLTGAAFVHDMELPGMVYGRVVRPVSYRARLLAFDAAKVRALPGVVDVLVDGNFIALCAEREEQAVRALEVAQSAARWQEANDLPEPREIVDLLPTMKSERSVVVQGSGAASKAATRLEATYSRPYIAHASIGPSCALAQFADGKLTVWSHSQGVHFLRGQIAKVLGLPAESVTVIHRDGAGCYGHNGADDVALDAALLARHCGRPVMLQWTREDELAWSPYGSAMAVKIAGGLDASGRIAEWKTEIWSHPHSTRPGTGDGVNLLTAWALRSPHKPSTPRDVPLPGGGGARNASPIYAIADREVIYNMVTDMPIRVSALRTLGAQANVFAIESFMDELAATIGADPVAFRLAHLEDQRARAVVEAAAKASGWAAGAKSDGVHGRGIGLGRYKNLSAYCAVVAEIEVAEKIRLKRLVAAVDAGEVVSPDGLKNQIEGGLIQAASWTLMEAVRWDRSRVLARSWEDYPILKFDEVPAVEVVLIDRPDQPPLGTGECAAGPTTAAIANALHHALGVRARHLPLTPERIARAME